MQQSAGLAGSDIFSLGQAPDGTILAGTGHGLYSLKNGAWGRIGDASFARAPEPSRAPAPAPVKGKRTTARRPVAKRPAATVKSFDGAVYAILTDGNTLYAATSQGLLTSANSGISWQGVEGAGSEDVYFLGSARSAVLAAGMKTMRLSVDDGKTWKPVVPPSELTQITAVAVDGEGRLWAGGREGVFFSEDNGTSWRALTGLYVGNANSIFYDQRSQRVLITSNGPNTLAFAVHLPEKKVSFWDTGWNLRLVRPVGDHLLGVTPFDGVVLQPRMVDSADVAHP